MNFVFQLAFHRHVTLRLSESLGIFNLGQICKIPKQSQPKQDQIPLQDRNVTKVWRLQNRTVLRYLLLVTRGNKKEGRRKGEGRTGIFAASFLFVSLLV